MNRYQAIAAITSILTILISSATLRVAEGPAVVVAWALILGAAAVGGGAILRALPRRGGGCSCGGREIRRLG